jgi:hypothetical protein
VAFKIFAYNAAGDQIDLADHTLKGAILAGAQTPVSNGVNLDNGSYQVYVLIDPNNTIDEGNEEDNEGEDDVTVP